MIYTSPFPKVELPACSVWEYTWSNPNDVPDTSVAVIDGRTGRMLTRGEVRSQSRQIAYGLRRVLGLKTEDVICIFSPNSIYYPAITLGAQCAGCIVSGANASYTVDELAHQLSDSASVLLMCHPGMLDVTLEATKAIGWSGARQHDRIVLAVMADEAGTAGATYKTLSDLVRSKHELEPAHIASPKNTVAYLGYSSGTSGKAKGVRTSHFNFVSAMKIVTPYVVTPQDTKLAVLPFNHIYGLSALVHQPLIQGAKIVVMPRFDMIQFCELVQEYKCTICLVVPPIALGLARAPVVDNYDFSSVRLIVSAAAPLSAELAKNVSTRLQCSVSQAFGLTETSPTTHYCPSDAPMPGSIGPLLPHVRGRIVDPETGKDVGPEEQGEMWLQGPNVMLGYLNRPDADQEAFHHDKDGRWFKTGDIAWVDKKGYYYITDRLKELIKYKGFQVAPAELEATCLECPYVADAAVIGVWNDEQATELPRAYVVLNVEGKKRDDGAESISDWVDGKVSHHKKLRGGVEIIDAIPKSPSGKILRRVLREKAKAEAAQAKATKAKF